MNDLIKRETVLAFVRRCKDRLQGKGLTYDMLVDYVESIPSAERKGEWIHDYHFGLALPEHKCSVCGEWECSDTESNYCPNCGADMREREGE